MKHFIYLMVSFLAFSTNSFAQNGVKVVAPETFQEMIKSDSTAFLLDVRTAEEYAEGHLEGAISLDWYKEEAFIKEAENMSKDKTYYLYCRSGRRSNAAATKMQSLGLNVIDMKGGFLAWTEAELPIVK